MNHIGDQQSQYGMSLIELLVAMVVGALLIALLNDVLHSVQSGWRKANVSAAASDAQLAGVQFLMASLSATFPPDPADQNTWFRGTNEQMEFLTVPPDADVFRGPVRVRLAIQAQTNGGKKLVVEMNSVNKNGTVEARSQPNVLYILGDLETVSFGFSGLRDDKLIEQVSWNDHNSLPKLIHLRFSFMDKNTRPLRLAIAPRRTISGQCQFDSISLQCRT